MSEDIKTLGIVLRRTNYGEADRILNLITPMGKISAIAKGVRRARSKLAGGVEMFCLSDLQIRKGRSELGVITSARMKQSYGRILKDYERMGLAGMVLKKIAVTAEHTESSEWFELTKQTLEGLDDGIDMKMVEAWFLLNLLRISGEEVNLYRDVEGEKLKIEARYDWNVAEDAFREVDRGRYGADEIKVMRLMSKGTALRIIRKIKIGIGFWDNILDLVRIMAKK